MYRFKIVFLLLTSSLVFSFCSPTKGLKKIDKAYTQSSVMGNDFNTALYQTSITLYSNYFSGLFFFKNYPNEDAFHIVSMSEFGLSFLDMKYENGDMTLNNIQGFLNRKQLIKILKNNLEILFIDTEKILDKEIFEDSEKFVKVIKFKHKSSRYYYFCNRDNKITKIVERSRGRERLSIFFEYNQTEIPSKIVFKNKGIKLKMELDLVRVN
jgi:hypothetical protein